MLRSDTVKSIVSTTTGPDSGAIVYDADTLVYRGLEPIEYDTPGSDYSFIPISLNFATSIEARLVDVGTSNDGWMLLDSVNGTFEDTLFRVTSATPSISIRLLSGTDEITVQSLDTAFAGDLTINALSDAWHPFSQSGVLPDWAQIQSDSIVRVNGDIVLPGKNITLNADYVYLGTAATHTDTGCRHHR